MPSWCKGALGLPSSAGIGICTVYAFTESLFEDSAEVLRHSCRSELPDKEFRTLGPLVTALYGARFNASLAKIILPLTFQHRAGVRTLRRLATCRVLCF